MSEIIPFFILLVVLVVIFQGIQAVKIFKGSKLVNKANLSNADGIQYHLLLKSIIKVPNQPFFWKLVRKQYLIAEASPSIEYEVKRKIYNEIRRLKVAGVTAPKKTNTKAM